MYRIIEGTEHEAITKEYEVLLKKISNNQHIDHTVQERLSLAYKQYIEIAEACKTWAPNLTSYKSNASILNKIDVRTHIVDLLAIIQCLDLDLFGNSLSSSFEEPKSIPEDEEEEDEEEDEKEDEEDEDEDEHEDEEDEHEHEDEEDEEDSDYRESSEEYEEDIEDEDAKDNNEEVEDDEEMEDDKEVEDNEEMEDDEEVEEDREDMEKSDDVENKYNTKIEKNGEDEDMERRELPTIQIVEGMFSKDVPHQGPESAPLQEIRLLQVKQETEDLYQAALRILQSRAALSQRLKKGSYVLQKGSRAILASDDHYDTMDIS